MIHEYEINGLMVKTGDILCTTNGGPSILDGQFWRYIGTLLPGDVDHVAVYVGPEGRCVEAGARGKVITFEVMNNRWDALKMQNQRGEAVDTLYGVARPVEGRGLSEDRKIGVREDVARYCLAQAAAGKPYNLNFLNPMTEDAFYCSQLPYLAYLKNGIDLNTGLTVPHNPATSRIVFPQDIWRGCVHEKCGQAGQNPGGAGQSRGIRGVSAEAPKKGRTGTIA